MTSAREDRPKIIIAREGINVEELAASTVGSQNVIDAFSFMQGDEQPEHDSGLVSSEGGFFAANLDDGRVRELMAQDVVEDVIDDEDVYALDLTPGQSDGDGEFDDLVLGDLELDEEEQQEIDEVVYMEVDSDEDPQLTPEDARLLSQMEPDVTEADIRFENQLLDDVADTSAGQLQQPLGIPKTQLGNLIKCIIKYVLEQRGSTEDVSEADIENILSASGMEESAAAAAADVILWNLRLIYAPYAWRYSRGTGVRVAVVDTGIYAAHSDLRVYGGVSYVPGRRSWIDDHYHGTHVAGIIAALGNRRGIIGVAPNARLYGVKVLNSRGSGQLSWILNGLIWCYRTRMHVVNLSLGSGARTHNPRVYNAAYERVGRLLRSRGILACAAAGNSGATNNPYVGNPARCPSYMAVSSIDRRRRRSSFSSYGPQVEICAPGSNIVSTVSRASYRALSGTSMACPHVAGVAALIKARRRTWHGDRTRVHMWRTAIDLGRPGRDWAFGYGQVNAYRAVR